MLYIKYIIGLISLCSHTHGAYQIVPGATWTVEDTGNHLQAHGTGLIKVDDWYYAVGENKTKTDVNPGGNLFNSVACYKSQDLTSWSFVNNILEQNTSVAELAPTRVIERPKVIYNALTDKYVMWMHTDTSNYGNATVGTAISDTVCGDYTFLNSSRPYGNVSRDMGLFVDDDDAATAYLMSEDRNNGARLYQLSADYLSIVNSTYIFDKDLEAPAMVKVNGTYFFFGSLLTGKYSQFEYKTSPRGLTHTGWATNDNLYATSTSLTGPWSDWANFAPVGTDTYNSQTTFVLPIEGSETASYVFLSDRWLASSLWASTYIWLPLTLDTETLTASITWTAKWAIDIATGVISTPGESTVYAAGNATTTGAVQSESFAEASTGEVVGPIGGNESYSGNSLTWTGVTFPESNFSVVFNYTNLSGNTSYAAVSVGGATHGTISFLTTNSGSIGSSVWQIGAGEIGSEASISLSFVTETAGNGSWFDTLEIVS